MKLNKKTTNIIAFCLLTFMGFFAFFSVLGDSLTMDELAHTPAGYSYVTQKDMRLNPEHPPLLKDLAGASTWLGSKIADTSITLPINNKSWQEDMNGQWNFGREFLYRSGNDTDKIIIWSRLPMILIMILLGFYVFRWTREIYGDMAGLLALFLYSFSPTFLAHGRYVTTDVGAAAAFFIGAYYLTKWITKINIKNIIIAGIALGLALLVKFSVILLVPYLIFLGFVWLLINIKNFKTFKKDFLKIALSIIVLGAISLVVIWPVYQYHVMDYPAQRQYSDTETTLQSFGRRMLADSVIWMSDKPILRVWGQYFFGLLMVVQRAVGGNTTYFLGQISKTGWISYFPIMFLIKVPTALLVFILMTLFIYLFSLRQISFKKPLKNLAKFLKEHFAQFSLITLFVIYWIATFRSNLNIGVRHILPTFPVIYILVSGAISKTIESSRQPMQKLLKGVIVILLLLYALPTINNYPHFLTYFNELVGGPSNGYKYVTDSNLDWGQDLRRLTEFVEENNIEKIYIDYFGGDSPQYRLGDKFQPWWGDRDPSQLPPDSWIAVSATFLQGGRGEPVPNYTEKTGYYNWLNQYKPVAIIGHSIFVYNIK